MKRDGVLMELFARNPDDTGLSPRLSSRAPTRDSGSTWRITELNEGLNKADGRMKIHEGLWVLNPPLKQWSTPLEKTKMGMGVGFGQFTAI